MRRSLVAMFGAIVMASRADAQGVEIAASTTETLIGEPVTLEARLVPAVPGAPTIEVKTWSWGLKRGAGDFKNGRATQEPRNVYVGQNAWVHEIEVMAIPVVEKSNETWPTGTIKVTVKRRRPECVDNSLAQWKRDVEQRADLMAKCRHSQPGLVMGDGGYLGCREVLGLGYYFNRWLGSPDTNAALKEAPNDLEFQAAYAATTHAREEMGAYYLEAVERLLREKETPDPRLELTIPLLRTLADGAGAAMEKRVSAEISKREQNKRDHEQRTQTEIAKRQAQEHARSSVNRLGGAACVALFAALVVIQLRRRKGAGTPSPVDPGKSPWKKILVVLGGVLLALVFLSYVTPVVYLAESLLGQKLEGTPGLRHLSSSLVDESRSLMGFGVDVTYWSPRQTDHGEPRPYVSGNNPDQDVSQLSQTFTALDPDWVHVGEDEVWIVWSDNAAFKDYGLMIEAANGTRRNAARLDVFTLPYFEAGPRTPMGHSVGGGTWGVRLFKKVGAGVYSFYSETQ